MKKLKLKISGMHCTSCAFNIDGELEDLGVKNASTSFAKQLTEVEFDEKDVTIEDMKATIGKLGYQADVVNE